MALLETLQADNEALGRKVSIAGRVAKPLRGAPQLLERCIANLIDNAALCGKKPGPGRHFQTTHRNPLIFGAIGIA